MSAQPTLDDLIMQRIEALLRERDAANSATPLWRELGAEASVRGLTRRAFRDWCHRMGVEIRDVGGVAYVAPAAVDRVIAKGPVRTAPPSLRVPATDEDAEDAREAARAQPPSRRGRRSG